MSNPIKLLECIRQGQIGGGESHLLSLVENLDRARFEPIVLSFTDGPMVGRLKEMGIRVQVIHTEKPFDITKWKRVKAFLERERVELVHAHGTRACSNVLWAARSLRLPVIYTIHGWSFHADQGRIVRRLRVVGEKYLTGRAQLNICVSASNRQSGLAEIPGLKAVVIANGIDQGRFSPGRPAAVDIRRALGIPGDAVLVLFVARFTAHKQPLTLIRAFGEALGGFPGLHLLMVGEGDEKEAGISLAKELGLGNKVNFEPFRQDVPELLAAADIFVLPSLWEGLPIGLLEAMAMGKAVIGTFVDGTREIVRSGDNGLLVKAGDAGELSSAIVQLARQPELRREIGQKAVLTVDQQYNASVMTRTIESYYEAMAGPEKAI